jgi:hypothetical protein
VLLVGSDEAERERLGDALEDAGYQVIACPGPTAPDYVCVGGREGSCPLLECADVVVLDPWLAGDDVGIGTTSDELLLLYSRGGRAVVTLGNGGWGAPFAVGPVIRLPRRPGTDEVVSAVRGAPDARGFVFRGPLDGRERPLSR